MEENKQTLTVTDRNRLHVDGVSSVVSFDSERIELNGVLGGITVEGEGLTVASLNLDQGQVSIEGQITAVAYGKSLAEKTPRHKGKTILNRLMK
ncbi:MAG: YabP/YqfC family sporulation protein [Firmicutes bacterium]|nr:YabP/YqfC family sporulation protein [Bacillota bacterium]